MARIIGPQGTVATLSAGVASRVGKMVTGSPRGAFSLRRGTVNAAFASPGIQGVLRVTTAGLVLIAAFTRYLLTARGHR